MSVLDDRGTRTRRTEASRPRRSAAAAHGTATRAAPKRYALTSPAPGRQPRPVRRPQPIRLLAAQPTLRPWLSSQATNVERHLAALRPFTRAEFGTGDQAPSEGHIQAVNELLSTLRRPLSTMTSAVRIAAEAAVEQPTPRQLTELLRLKSKAHDWVRATERIWDFYLELFGQRQSRYAEWLLGCDRIALDCYQYAYLGLGTARSIPAPPPFSYMRTGFSPATFRRGIPLRRLGRRLNPFPLIQLPYHRLVNPWTLGAVLHEISHNLQNDLGLQHTVPRAIQARLRAAGLPPGVTATWTHWNREIYADLSGLLLGGPEIVGSLFDVVGRSPELSLGYVPGGVHPTPYLRGFLSTHLLARMGFTDRAAQYERMWRRLYPNPARSSIPAALLRTAPTAVPAVVDAVCYTPFPSLGNRTLASVLRFEKKEQAMVEEAADRLARGVDPGVVPERFLIGAVRFAADRGLAGHERLMRNFFSELARR
ncbi:hypothetical protein FCH28_12925 [Streptomyces piniterrae]|uniref:Uncharacterized protein n=1 Tax=Streptomyces piniterrae TaxID=2571125 RepID=A0A4U0NJ58_9ACTN|nr:hypothetical protein [Streptomyces piniterrae]TJZ54103.1 hypothetical protein FCH28_12925 [Streptomyces piniterrae]